MAKWEWDAEGAEGLPHLTPLVTVRPGPVLHVWHGGKQVVAVPLSHGEALVLCRDLLGALGNEPAR